MPETFDCLIVGGGSAGCVLANRLSARSALNVALIEAGADTPPDHNNQVLWDPYPGFSYFDRRNQWSELRVQLRPGGPERTYEQARVMGGGSSINGMMANRGQALDYDEWAEEGAAGWTWQSVAPYFRKLERDLDYGGDEHSQNGNLPIRRVPKEQWPGFSVAATEAVLAGGLPWIEDQNTTEFVPACFPITVNNDVNEAGVDRRASTAVAYLTSEVRQRQNLTILSNTRMINLLFEGNSCVGVEVESINGPREIRAGQVILSAGSIHTPAMLMRAGIGPAEHLRSLGIEVVTDLAGVGQNLMEHPMISISGFLSKSARQPDSQRRHIFLGMRWSSGVADCPPADMYGVAINRTAWHPIGCRIGGFLTWINKSYSRGEIKLVDSSPNREPRVQFNLLSDERDLTRMKDAARYIAGLFDFPAVKRVAGSPFPTSYTERFRKLAVVSSRNKAITSALGLALDGPEFVREKLLRNVITDGTTYAELVTDDEALSDYLKSTVTGIWHASGTCKMGNRSDPLAVCDSEGRVFGIEGLRVCDGSVMPTIPCANINVPIIMIAERMADLILQSN